MSNCRCSDQPPLRVGIALRLIHQLCSLELRSYSGQYLNNGPKITYRHRHVDFAQENDAAAGRFIIIWAFSPQTSPSIKVISKKTAQNAAIS